MKTERSLTANGAAPFEWHLRGMFGGLDRVGDYARAKFLVVRAMVGLELAAPVVLVVQ